MKQVFNLCVLLIALVLAVACSKKQEELSLNQNYLMVADAFQYCQGSCDIVAPWEEQVILLTGHLLGANNDSIFQDNKSKSRFYLLDIRNGLFIQIQVEADEEAIFDRLATVRKTDIIYLRGTASAIIAQDVNQCTKGVVILIDEIDNLQLNQ